ncbi:MAG TPA: Wzz/FepE/Etk N-terminal domain-containing protein [Miltoncostaeaceae bacterium]|nr:Wzz/FepE/Etk N-terminal domain-containing protein [Miltoncostaeaceae bacterium]
MDREITLRDYGRVLWSGRWLILATTVAAAVVGLLLTFVTSTTYTGTAKVFLGQATTVSGAPFSTPATNPATAATVLSGDNLVTRVAREIGVSPSRVRNGVTLTAPRAPGGAQGNQPTVMTITFKDGSRTVAREGANAYARAIDAAALQNFSSVFQTYATGEARAQADVTRLQAQIDGYQRDLRNADAQTRTLLQSLLFSATTQLSIAQTTLTDQQLNRAKAEANEKPYIVSLSESPSSSSSAPNRLRTVVLAAIIGLLVGIIVTFVWRGSPAGRAGRE